MPDSRELKAEELLHDLRSSLSVQELMNKCGLTVHELETALRLLVDGGLLGPGELQGLGIDNETTSHCFQTRLAPRTSLRVPAAIHDVLDTDRRGVVIDLSQKGFRVNGLRAEAGQEKILLICADESEDVGMIVVGAACRWARTDPQDGLLREAGFEITHISDRSRRELQKLIEGEGI